ncbi:MAG TPA: hypothetical protein VI997_02715 [Candidatus Thermoplasmatota archaeon]|nr:hypothetical protein [Candidatus Thermoplasmatota archaeon]
MARSWSAAPLLTGLKRAAAVSPGHITGFFEIRDQAPEPEKRGSRGAGFCIDLGALSLVEVEPAEAQSVHVVLDKAPSDAPVTRSAVLHLIQEALLQGKVALDRDAPRGERAKVAVRVFTDLGIPVSQGFGASGAGAYSAALATARALGLGRSDALLAAHAAEVRQRTGLGDVVAMAHGGFEIRASPGLPPWGSVKAFVGYGDVVLCSIGDGLATKSVLTDAKKRAAINAAGARLVDRLLAGPSPELFVELSRAFAEETGLMTPEVREAVDAARRAGGMASMSMLGSSVFSLGRVDAVADALEPYGAVLRTRVDERAARLLDIASSAPPGRP